MIVDTFHTILLHELTKLFQNKLWSIFFVRHAKPFKQTSKYLCSFGICCCIKTCDGAQPIWNGQPLQ